MLEVGTDSKDLLEFASGKTEDRSGRHSMANMFDYLEWRADVPFSVDPFNEVDNLILSELAYTDFDDIVPSSGTPVSLAEAHREFFVRNSREELLKSFSFHARAPLLMDQMLTGARFQSMKLNHYINEVDEGKDAQISAVTFYLPDDSIFIAFRGTDSSLVGWKEDFNLSFLSETAGQQRAVDYLNEMIPQLGGTIRVGGHSKGGNFAVYAASFCEYPERIETVYNNDGPGFRDEILKTQGYRDTVSKTVSIIPDTSIIGLLLSSGAEQTVIKSTAAGIAQHDAFSWSVQRNRFIRASLSDSGKFVSSMMDSWIEKMDDEVRKSFTDTVFSIFEATGKETFHEISLQKLKNSELILKALRKLPKDKQKELLRLGGQLVESGKQTALSQLLELISPGDGKEDQ